jgi:Secretion system C-terminal sorting domain
MKRFLLFITVLSGLQSLFSQNSNRATHTGIDVSHGIVSINSKSFYTETVEENCCFKGLYLIGLNNNGAEVWKSSFVIDEFSFPRKLITSIDKHLVLLANGSGCDVPGNRNLLAKLDTLGTIVFQYTIEPSDKLIDFVQYPDGTFYLISNTKIYHYSALGTYMGQVSTNFTSFQSISVLSNGNLLLSYLAAVNNLAEINTSGTIINQSMGFNYGVKFLQSSNGTLFGLNNAGTLIKYGSNLSQTATANQNIGVNLMIKDFTINRDSIYVTGFVTTNNKPFYAVLNTNFNLIHLPQPTVLTEVKPSGITKTTSGKIRIITTGNSSSNTNYSFTGLFEMPSNGNFYTKSDVGVTSSSTTSLAYFNSGNNKLSAFLQMNVNVTNFGTDTVKSFYLNHYSKDFLCLVLLHKKCQVVLAPGQSTTVPTGTFYIASIPTNSLGLPLSTTLNICVFTTLPNNLNDINVSNDAGCLIAPINLSLNSFNVIEKLAMFPNPFKDKLTIDGEFVEAKISVYTLLGDVVFKTKLVQSENQVLNLAELIPGVYLVEIETEKGTSLQKIIKN